MRIVSVANAKSQLPSLMQAAEAGERVLITRHGKPVAEVMALNNGPADVSPAALDWLAERRRRYTSSRLDSVSLIRAMRDEDDH